MNAPVMSLVGFNSLAEIIAYKSVFGSSVQFELSYRTSAELLAELHPFLYGQTASVHACCPQTEFFPNLASSDTTVIAQSLADLRLTLKTAQTFGATIAVLHTGYVTDKAMPRDYSARKLILDSAEFVPYSADKKTAVCFPDYIEQPVYRQFASRAKENLARAAREFRQKGVLLAAENLNPRVGYLFQTPQELCELAVYDADIFLCLDIGHLYIASCIFDFDFLSGIQKILSTGKVVSCHLHSNPSNKTHFHDAHHSIDKNNFPIIEIIQLLQKTHSNLVLEVVEEFEHNTRVLLNVLNSKGHRFLV